MQRVSANGPGPCRRSFTWEWRSCWCWRVCICPGCLWPGSAAQLETAQSQLKPLESEVQNLRVYKQRRAELESEMDALQKQLATLQTIVPEEKEADQFILMIQRSALGSGVAIRTLTAKPVAQKPYYFEMPFEIQADGPYYGVLDFFSSLGRLSRIINVGDLKLASVGRGTAREVSRGAGNIGDGNIHNHYFFQQSSVTGGVSG